MTNSIYNCKSIAKINGGRCISETYINNSTKLQWKCKSGHLFYMNYNSVQQGQWCKICGIEKRSEKNRKYTIEDCARIAKSRDGFCISDKYISVNTTMQWKCNMGHVWNTTFGNIKSGCWCRVCARKIVGKKNKKSIEDCIKIAQKYGGDCLSNNYENSKHKMKWRCKNGHIFFTSYGIVQQGSWCSICTKPTPLNKKNISDCDALANKIGAKCISRVYNNACEKLVWECSNGHEWMSSYNNIQQGRGCPNCSNRISKRQNILLNIIKNLFPKYNVENNYRGFDWLSTDFGGKQEFDIFIPDLSLAIEYDGRQHFFPVNFGGISNTRAHENLKYIQSLDKLKEKKVNEHKEDVKYFIRFKYNEILTMASVCDKLKKAGISKW